MNYQEHIQQQRRVIENNNQARVGNNRSKDKAPISYEYKGYQGREERQEKKYAPIVHEKKEYSYQPPKPEVKREERREVKYPTTRVEVKKEEPKKYISSINPPASTHVNHYKK